MEHVSIGYCSRYRCCANGFDSVFLQQSQLPKADRQNYHQQHQQHQHSAPTSSAPASASASLASAQDFTSSGHTMPSAEAHQQHQRHDSTGTATPADSTAVGATRIQEQQQQQQQQQQQFRGSHVVEDSPSDIVTGGGAVRSGFSGADTASMLFGSSFRQQHDDGSGGDRQSTEWVDRNKLPTASGHMASQAGVRPAAVASNVETWDVLVLHCDEIDLVKQIAALAEEAAGFELGDSAKYLRIRCAGHGR